LLQRSKHRIVKKLKRQTTKIGREAELQESEGDRIAQKSRRQYSIAKKVKGQNVTKEQRQNSKGVCKTDYKNRAGDRAALIKRRHNKETE
jgi:hypothetical protein